MDQQLSKEEKQRIYLEEKERQAARKQIISEEQTQKTTGILALIGGSLLILGLFLPWMSLGLLSATGFDKTQDATVLLACGGAYLALGVYGIATGKKMALGSWVVTIINGAYIAWLYIALLDQAGIGTYSPKIGNGFYVSLAGAFFGLISSIYSLKKEKREDANDESMVKDILSK
jgi:hypothetical protein